MFLYFTCNVVGVRKEKGTSDYGCQEDEEDVVTYTLKRKQIAQTLI